MRACLIVTILGILGICPSSGASGTDPAVVESFEKTVRPLLIERCVSCHGPQKQKGGLRLDTAEGLVNGGDSGPVVVAGKPDESSLIRAVRYADDLKMPPKGRLSDAEVAALTDWVRSGAEWPAVRGTEPERDRHALVAEERRPALGLPADQGPSPARGESGVLAEVANRSLHP